MAAFVIAAYVGSGSSSSLAFATLTETKKSQKEHSYMNVIAKDYSEEVFNKSCNTVT